MFNKLWQVTAMQIRTRDVNRVVEFETKYKTLK